MPALDDSELTEAEKIAKRQFQLLYKEAYYIPCDVDDIDVLPSWYDEEKYKCGQKYFNENRLGILNSNLIGLICLLTEPKGLAILASTNRSSTKETARKRYISTVLHTLRWYEIDLSPGSESRKSLAIVRKLHFASSKNAEKKNIGHITQAELSLTAFGFMGLVLVRADFLGIHYDNQKDREAFVHLWAVLCNMIGIKDKYNICLMPFDALQVLCKIIIRYLLIPSIQIEVPEFKKMTQAMIDGLSDVLPNLDYETQMFTAKLILGVPGYQYKINHSQVELCRSIFNQNEIDELNKLINMKEMNYINLTVDIPIIEIVKIDKLSSKISLRRTDTNMNHRIEMNKMEKKIHSLLELENTECVNIYYIDYEDEWKNCTNDEKFCKLSAKGQRRIRIRYYGRILLDYKVTRYVIESIMSMVLNRMRKEANWSNSSTTAERKSNIVSVGAVL